MAGAKAEFRVILQLNSLESPSSGRKAGHRASTLRPVEELARHVATALATARSLGDEVHALTAGLDGRARAWVLTHWGHALWPVPSFATLGREAGVTRERVRQVVALHEARLRQLRDRRGDACPSLAVRAAAVLSAGGGIMTSRAYTRALAKAGIVAEPHALRALTGLSSAKLIPPILWDAAADLWFDAAHRHVAEGGALDHVRQQFLMRGRRALRLIGAVDVGHFATAAPLPDDHAAELLFGAIEVTRVSGYLVPDVQRDSRLTRHALEMAAVSPGIRLEDIRRGLRRLRKPIQLGVPVIRRVLERHPDFRLEGDSVHLVHAPPIQSLVSSADMVLIAALQERDGTMQFPDIQALLASSYVGRGYLLHAAHAPWLVGVRGGLALRGHPASRRRMDLREARVGGAAAPTRTFERLLLIDRQRAVVRYRVTPAALRGSLRVPKRLGQRLRDSDQPWTVRLIPTPPSDSTVTVGADGGSLWDLRPWLLASNARSGQYVELAVTFSEQRVTLRLLSESE